MTQDELISNTFAHLDFWPFLPEMLFSKSNKINELILDENLVFAPFHYLAKVLIRRTVDYVQERLQSDATYRDSWWGRLWNAAEASVL